MKRKSHSTEKIHTDVLKATHTLVLNETEKKNVKYHYVIFNVRKLSNIIM